MKVEEIRKKLDASISSIPAWIRYGIVVLLLVTLFLVPFMGFSRYFFRIINMAGIYSILALSLNLLTGYLGLVSMGHAAYYAIGAYASALLCTKLDTDFFVSAIFAIIIAAACGFCLGLPSLRLSGSYLAIITLGFAEIVKVVAMNWKSVTNGALGVKASPKPEFFGVELTNVNGGLYYLILISAIVVALFCYALKKSKTGRAFYAIKDDELAASLMGLKTNRYKVLGFTIAAAIAGYAGALYAPLAGYIDPNTFTFDTSTLVLCMVILGGMGSIKGMFVGAFLLVLFPEVLRFMETARFLVYGAVLIVMMRFKPSGLFGSLPKKPYRLPKGVELHGKYGDLNA